MHIPYTTTLALWIRAHGINLLLSLFILLLFASDWAVMLAFIGSGIGLVVSVPMLPLIHFTITATLKMPYSFTVRWTSLSVFLGLIVVLCWGLLFWCMDLGWQDSGFMNILTAGSVLSVILSQWTLLSAFRRYQQEAEAIAEVIDDQEVSPPMESSHS